MKQHLFVLILLVSVGMIFCVRSLVNKERKYAARVALLLWARRQMTYGLYQLINAGVKVITSKNTVLYERSNVALRDRCAEGLKSLIAVLQTKSKPNSLC